MFTSRKQILRTLWRVTVVTTSGGIWKAHSQSLQSSSGCSEPVCIDKHDLLRKSFASLTSTRSSSTDNHKIIDSNSGEVEEPCPLDRGELGHRTWDVIHTIAAYYPEHPSTEEAARALEFFESLAALYPCHECAKDFQTFVQQYPPRTGSREELVLWCCQLHNSVNEKLEKPVYPCEFRRLDQRWRLGRKSCLSDEL